MKCPLTGAVVRRLNSTGSEDNSRDLKRPNRNLRVQCTREKGPHTFRRFLKQCDTFILPGLKHISIIFEKR